MKHFKGNVRLDTIFNSEEGLHYDGDGEETVCFLKSTSGDTIHRTPFDMVEVSEKEHFEIHNDVAFYDKTE